MPSIEQRSLYAQELKQCSDCKEILPFAAFNQRIEGGKEYCTAKCKTCAHLHYMKRRHLIREHNRQYNLGVPVGTYNFLIAEFGAQCSMCGTKDPGGQGQKNGQFHIDHDHESGRVRGLLCNNCNVGIGMLQHSAKLLLAGIEYLARPGYTVDELVSFLGDTRRSRRGGKSQLTSQLSAEDLGL